MSIESVHRCRNINIDNFVYTGTYTGVTTQEKVLVINRALDLNNSNIRIGPSINEDGSPAIIGENSFYAGTYIKKEDLPKSRAQPEGRQRILLTTAFRRLERMLSSQK